MASLAEDFEPREWQSQIIGNPGKGIEEDKTKYKVIVAHRKSGKTVVALMYLFMRAYLWKQENQGAGIRLPRFTYIAPTYGQAKDIAWDLLKTIVPRWACLRRPNETQMEIRMTSGAILNLKGADREDSLRGPGLAFAVLDEMGFMKPHVWQQIIEPELGATGGGAMFIGTPNGRDHFYNLFKMGRDGTKNWKSWLLPATEPTLNFFPDTPRGPQLLSPGFLEQVRQDTTEKFYLQEYECAFQDNAGMVFDRIDENVVDEFREYPEAGHRYRIGFDPALREDFSVLSVMDLTDYKVKYVYRTNKIDAELLVERTINMSHHWTTEMGPPEIVMDTTGMGDPLYERLASQGVNILPVRISSNKIKLDLVSSLAIRLNKDEIKIPRYEWLIDELKDYRYEKLPSGRYRYGAPSGKHDDGVISLCLLCYQLPPKITPMRSMRRMEEGMYNRFTGREM